MSEPTTEAAKPSETRKVVSKARLRSLLSKCRQGDADVAEITGTLREEIGTAVDKHGLHKKAFSLVRKLDKLEPEQLREWWDAFQHLWDISGLEERAASVQPMQFEPSTEGEEAGEADGEKDVRPRDARQRAEDRQFPAPVDVAAE